MFRSAALLHYCFIYVYVYVHAHVCMRRKPLKKKYMNLEFIDCEYVLTCYSVCVYQKLEAESGDYSEYMYM